VEADDGCGGGNQLTLLQLHIGSCTKVTEQQSNGTEVCCCSSPAGGEAAYHISLYQWTTLFKVSRQPEHCADPDCLHSVFDYRTGIFLSGHQIQSSISGFPDID